MATPTRTPDLRRRSSQAERAMTALHTELHSLETGAEPNHERIQRALLELVAEPASLAPGAVRELATRLCSYMRELRQDEMELSLEDLDVLLECWSRLDTLVSGGDAQAPLPTQPAPVTAALQPIIGGTGGAPVFWNSGLQVENLGPQLRILLPTMEQSRTTAMVLGDLTELWEITPNHIGWQVDLTRLERIPVSLLSLLVHLHRASPAKLHRIELIGGVDQVQSNKLQECLSRCFELRPENWQGLTG